MTYSLGGCESRVLDKENPEGPEPETIFPDYITTNEKYFDTRINGIPTMDSEEYRLSISGMVENPALYTLEDLLGLDLVKRTLTIECIGNASNGSQIGTAEWRGFSLYELLESHEIQEGAKYVKYISADGYFTYNTLEELKNEEVLGAMYMNDEAIPIRYGFPLRIIFPGYYGVRQPGWITAIQVMETGPEDFWSGSGWKSDTSMTIDSKIFFPLSKTNFSMGDSIKIGGSAFGARRIASVDVSLDDGSTWIPANIRQSLDEDFVWVFWEASVFPASAGTFSIRSRATAEDGNVQPKLDNTPLDGTNSWPSVKITVSEGSIL